MAIKIKQFGVINVSIDGNGYTKDMIVKDIKKVLEPIAQNILEISFLLEPFMPKTSEILLKQFSEKQIRKGESLFPRLNSVT